MSKGKEIEKEEINGTVAHEFEAQFPPVALLRWDNEIVNSCCHDTRGYKVEDKDNCVDVENIRHSPTSIPCVVMRFKLCPFACTDGSIAEMDVLSQAYCLMYHQRLALGGGA